jgi:hypothetical protein
VAASLRSGRGADLGRMRSGFHTFVDWLARLGIRGVLSSANRTAEASRTGATQKKTEFNHGIHGEHGRESGEIRNARGTRYFL